MASMAKAPTEDTTAAPDISLDVVLDGDQDIAIVADKQQMMVQAPGRKPFQRVFLWTGGYESASGKKKENDKGLTNKPYSFKDDKPNENPVPLLPVGLELQPGEETVEYLEVGIVCGGDPHKYKVGKQKVQAAKEREARGVLVRDRFAIRAFFPVTPKITTNSKFYVGVKPTAGRLIPRTTNDEAIFFYPEFFDGLSEAANKSDRKTFINQRVRKYAANTEDKAERSTAAIMTAEDMTKWTTSNPLILSPPENLTNTIVLQYTLFAESRDRSYIRAILTSFERANPDLVFGPHTASQGVASFIAFDGDPFTWDNALSVVRELKVAAPTMKELRASVVQATHRILMGDENLRARLPYADLGFFLSLCNRWFPSASSLEEMDDHVLLHKLEQALEAVEEHGLYKTVPTASGSTVELLSEKNYRLVLKCIMGIIEQIDIFSKDFRQQVAEQHGGVMKHAGMNELITKIANAIDVVTQQSNFEQLANIHAVLFASGNVQVADKLTELNSLISKVLDLGKE